MSIFLAAAMVLRVTASFSFLNEPVLGLQTTIGLLIIAPVFTVALGVLK